MQWQLAVIVLGIGALRVAAYGGSIHVLWPK